MVVVPVEVSVRIQCDDKCISDPESRLKRVIRKSYRNLDRKLPNYRNTTTVEKVAKEHPDEPGTPYKATLRTEILPTNNLKRWNNAVTNAVEHEFNTEIVGAQITIEDADGNSQSFGW